MLSPARKWFVALFIVALPMALVLALAQTALGAFPSKPSNSHRCLKDELPQNQDDCFELNHIRRTSAALLDAVYLAEEGARRAENRAQARGTRSAWREAVAQRAIALGTMTNARKAFVGLTRRYKRHPWWQTFPKTKAQDNLTLHAALMAMRIQEAKKRLRADIDRARGRFRQPLPRSLVVRRAETRARIAATAMRKITGTTRDTYPAGGEPSELWATYSRRLPTITGAMGRALKPLGRRIRPSERRSRLAFLDELVVVYRDDALQVQRRAKEAKAAGRPCSAELLEHANNALKRAATIQTLIAAVKRGERRRIAKKRALKKVNTLAGRGREIARRVRSCLADQLSTPTPAPTPPATPLGNVSSALCPRGLKIGDVAVKLVEHRLVNPFRTDPNTSGTFTCRYESPPESGLEVPAEAGVDLTYLREHSDRRRICGIPAGVPGYLNSATHEIQVFVPPWVDGADGVRASLLATLEAANIGVPC